MLRKLNFTERAKIPRSNVRVTLRRDESGTLVFDPQLSFDGVGAVPSARVYIEAYYRSSFMRFDCGSVSCFAPPEDRRLTDIDDTSVVHFRVKVVDNDANDHRIVAVADDLVISEERHDAAGRLPLLPVNFTDSLGEQAWRIAFELNEPVLELNNRIVNVEDVSKNDPAFLALVYPAAVRQILTKILLVDEQNAHDDGEEWWNRWLRWASHYDAQLPADRDDAPFWIDEVVGAFCRELQLIERWRAARSTEAS